MGLDYHLYMGPYVECWVREEKREVDVYGCTNPSCKEHAKRDRWPNSDKKFCAACAAPWGASKKTIDHVPSPYTVLGDDADSFVRLYSEGEGDEAVYLGSNRRGDRQHHYDTRSDSLHQDMADIDQMTEMAGFEQAFSAEIEKLKEAYDDVTVRWGVHLYCS